MEYIITAMLPEDVPAVTALEERCFSEPWTAQGFLDALQKEDAIFLAAKTADGHVIGFCGLYQALDEGDITNVAVEESVRGAGVGHALITELKRLAVGRGISRIFLEVRESNAPARHLYEKNGFEIIGKRKHFYRKPDEDAVLMMADSDTPEEGKEK